jgi:hypothetical protein
MSTRNIFPAAQKDPCRGKSKKKNEKKSGEETSALLGDTNVFYARHTSRLSYQNNFHIHTEKYIYMCIGRPIKRVQ